MWPERRLTVAKILLAVALSLFASFPRIALAAQPAERPLQLEVLINGERTGLIGAFLELADGRIATRTSELRELGVRVLAPAADEDIVVLDSLSDIGYHYDEAAQTISLTLPDGRRAPQVYDARGAEGEAIAAASGYGAVLDYSLFASQSLGIDDGDFLFNGASATLDNRVFGPFGTFSQSAIVGTTTARDFDALRLETSFQHSDPDSLMSYGVGDGISGGLLWTRPIRFGGIQVRRNFGLRPDLVTTPLPSFAGSAAVPSTLDVYLENVSIFSRDISTGPFQITNLPALSGQDARVVLRDSAGHEVQSILPLYSSPDLLQQGLSDFSAEAGFPRLAYGTQSADYIGQPFASLSYRLGVSDWLTAEAHGEYGDDLLDGGVGAVVRAGSAGVLSLAASGSDRNGETGALVFASYDAQLFDLSFNFSTQRTLGDYLDVASVALRTDPAEALADASEVSARPPKALDRISISAPLPWDASNLSLSLVNIEPASGSDARIISASWSRPCWGDGQLFATAFADFAGHGDGGFYIGFSMPLGWAGSASSGVTSGSDGIRVTTDLVKPLAEQVGSYGWKARDSEGNGTDRLAAGSYRSRYAAVESGIGQNDKTFGVYGQADGSVAMMNGHLFFANRIDDSFAVIDAALPNIDVLYENRPIGKTDESGLLLVPGLRSYTKNKISIDPRGLPLDADAGQTQATVVPADRSGVVVRFGVSSNPNIAVAIFVDSGGTPLPVGSTGALNDGNGGFIVGYDGRAYLTDLKPANAASISIDGAECHASFPFAPAPNRQVVIGPVVCR